MKLTISTHLGQPVQDGAAAVFPQEGGSLGHRSDNTLVLADRHGTIAGRHAVLYRGADGWRIVPEPGATVAVNGHAVGHGHEWPLQLGDVLEIGPYVLVPGEEYSAWSGLAPAGVQAPPPAGQPHPLRGDATRMRSSDDPLAGFAQEGKSIGALQDAPIDPLALFSGPAAATDPAWDDPLLAGLDHGLPADAPKEAFGPSVADNTPEYAGHLRMQIQWPQEPASTPTAAAPSSGASPEASPLASADRLLQSFMEGLGPPAKAGWPDESFMRLLGATLRVLRTQQP